MKIVVFILKAVAGSAALLLIGAFCVEFYKFGRDQDRNNFMRSVSSELWDYRDEHRDDLKQNVGDKDHPHSWRVPLAMRLVQVDKRLGRAVNDAKYDFQSNWDEERNVSGELWTRFADSDDKTTRILGLFDEHGEWFARVRTGTQDGRKHPRSLDRRQLDPVVLICLPDSGVFWNEPVDIVAHRGSNTLTLRGQPLHPKRLSGCVVFRLFSTIATLPVTDSEEEMFDALLSPEPINPQDRHPARLPGEDAPGVVAESK